MNDSPAQFYSESWKKEENELMQNTINSFEEKVKLWPWNNGLTIRDSVYLPFFHGTSAIVVCVFF